MRIFHISPLLSVLLCFLLWGMFQVGFALLCAKLPARLFRYHGGYYKCHSWEDGGKVYQRIFKIRLWKGYLPDGSAISKIGMKKKHIEDYSKEGILAFLEASCRAEMTHLLVILPFPIFGLFCPPIVVPIMFLYALCVNLPCMIAQRYNRPRFCRLLSKQLEHLLV